MGTNWNTGGSIWASENTLLLCDQADTHCPGRLWSLPPWRYSKAILTWAGAVSSRWPCLSIGLNQMVLQRSLPNSTILWFCDRAPYNMKADIYQQVNKPTSLLLTAFHACFGRHTRRDCQDTLEEAALGMAHSHIWNGIRLSLQEELLHLVPAGAREPASRLGSWGTWCRMQNWEWNYLIVFKHKRTSLCCLAVVLPPIRTRPLTSRRVPLNVIIVKKSVFPCRYHIVRNHSNFLFLEEKCKTSDIIVQYCAWTTVVFLGDLVCHSNI